MRIESIQRKNAQVSCPDEPSTPFDMYILISNEKKMSALISELNRIRSVMADSNEIWSLEGLSESLKMLASWTDESISAIKKRKAERM